MDDHVARAVDGQVGRGAARVLAVLGQLYGELRARFPEGLRPWLCRCPQRLYAPGQLSAVCPACGEAFVLAPPRSPG